MFYYLFSLLKVLDIVKQLHLQLVSYINWDF